MVDEQAVLAFAAPYYADKDMMHNMWHIKLVKGMMERILSISKYPVDRDCLLLAVYFHGFIYQDEQAIRQWLKGQNYGEEKVARILQIAWESQRHEVPRTVEGKILHDAHVLEGGKAYLAVKTLITGSVRGQSLMDTLKYMEENVLDKNKCYLPETIPLCEEMNRYTNQFFQDLAEGVRISNCEE